MDFRKLPKIELHCHLDGCVRLETAKEIASQTGVAMPPSLREAMVAPECCADLADYIRRFDFALELMQREQDLFRIAEELVESWAAENVIYGETRFAPFLHGRRGLTSQQALEAVHAGLKAGERKFGVRTGLIVCCLRHHDPEHSTAVARFAAGNMDKVCALDIAGDELRFGAAPHMPAFALAEQAGLRRTVHAGEAAGTHSLREAIDLLHAERLGHGVRVEQPPQLVDELREREMPLEMCPRSNVQTRCVESLEAHPIARLLQLGLKVTVSTDGRTVSDTSVTSEFESLTQHQGWGWKEFWSCQFNAANAAFVSSNLKNELLARLTAERKRTESARRDAGQTETGYQ
jgi:adenosine deaminase